MSTNGFVRSFCSLDLCQVGVLSAHQESHMWMSQSDIITSTGVIQGLQDSVVTEINHTKVAQIIEVKYQWKVSFCTTVI